MTSKDKHKKHGKLTRPNLNRFGRIEICLVGTTCDQISSFVNEFREYCSSNLKVGYVDASHHEEVKFNKPIYRAALENGSFSVNSEKENEWHLRHDLLDVDIVFVNGNHFEASCQLVFIDEKKEKSLEKRMNWINDIRLIIKKEVGQKVYSFMEKHVQANIPIRHQSNAIEIFDWILKYYDQNIAELKALVLGGGKSLRMGKDKSQLEYHGEAQEIYIAKLIRKIGVEVYLSKRDMHSVTFGDFPVLADRVLDIGPFGALMTAFMEHPDSAWLVVACDLPFISKKEIDLLIKQRDPSKIATAFKAKGKEFPEPLITIWEPKAYPVLLKFLAQGVSCPRKVLINSDVKVIELADAQIVENVNTPEEFERAIKYAVKNKI